MTQTDTADEQGDGMVCSADGVVVRVRRREARDEVPAYEYVVGSEREESVAVRVRQPIPADVATADLGFPSACEDDWTLDGSDMVAQLVVEPGEQAQTIWGVRSEEHPSIEPPTVEARAVADSGSGGVQSEDAADDGSLDLEAPPDADLDAEAGVGAESDVGADADVGSLEADDADALPGSDSVVAQMVDELESGRVDEQTRTELADALEVHGSDSANAFVEHVKDKLQRRAQQLQEEVESLEGSVEQLYGVKADASEIASIKRGLSDLDDRALEESDLRGLQSQIEAVESDAAAERAAVREELDALSEEAVDAERVAEVATAVDELRDVADGLETQIDDLASRHDELASRQEQLAARHEELADDHDDLASAAATDEDVERLREDVRANNNATKSELAAIRTSLDEEYTSASEISAHIDRRFRRSLGTLVFFAIGAVGLATSVPLALDGSGAAAVTMLVGAVALGLWWHLVGSGDDDSIFSRLPSPRSLLG